MYEIQKQCTSQNKSMSDLLDTLHWGHSGIHIAVWWMGWDWSQWKFEVKWVKELLPLRVLRIGRGGTCAHAVISKQSFDGSHRSEDLLKRMFRILEARHPDLFLASQSSSPSPHLETARSITCILNHLAGETILECLWHDIWLSVSSQKTQ